MDASVSAAPLTPSPSHFIHCFGFSSKSNPEKTTDPSLKLSDMKAISQNEETEKVGNIF